MQFTNGLRIDYFFTICANGMDRDAAFPNGIRSCVLDMDESLQLRVVWRPCYPGRVRPTAPVYVVL